MTKEIFNLNFNVFCTKKNIYYEVHVFYVQHRPSSLLLN
jgi:hypothetical protein